MKVAIFGGSFDPPHLGHLMGCCVVLSTGGVEQVWLVPCYQHAFAKALSPFDDRFDMCCRATELFGGRVRVSEVEREMGGRSWTVDTLSHLRRKHPVFQFSLILGMDVLHDRHHWKGFDEIRRATPLHVLGRQGVEPLEEFPSSPPLPPVSSTEIRRRLRAGEEVGHLVPLSVLELIRERGLYR